MPLHFFDFFLRQDDRGDFIGVVGFKLDQIETSDRREDLVLGADVFLEDFLLDIEGHVGKIALGDKFPFERFERVDEPDGKRRTRS